MLTFVCAKWGPLFGARHVNVLRAALARHVALDHALVCLTDDPAGIDGDVRIVPLPTTYAHTPRCRRRMQFYARAFAAALGPRLCYVDLDVVIVADLTPIVDRPEPIVVWKVAHAGVYSGAFILCDAGALDGAWQRFAAAPDAYPARLQARGIASDQAMINDFLTGQRVATWTERDGFVTFYGPGYERLEALGVGPRRRTLPAGARIVVLGSADLAVLEDPGYAWAVDHWQALRPAGVA